jgi:hypothetical protein
LTVVSAAGHWKHLKATPAIVPEHRQVAHYGGRALDVASGIELGFPRSLYGHAIVQDLRYGGMRDRIDV